MTYDMNKISKRIKYVIEKKGYVLSNICTEEPVSNKNIPKDKEGNRRHIDISRQTLSKILNGEKTEITLNQLCSIANFLNVSISYLLCEDDFTSKERIAIHNTLWFSDETIDFFLENHSKCAWIINYLASNSPDLFKQLLQSIIEACDFEALYKCGEQPQYFTEEEYKYIYSDDSSMRMYHTFGDASVVRITEEIQMIKNSLDYLEFEAVATMYEHDSFSEELGDYWFTADDNDPLIEKQHRLYILSEIFSKAKDKRSE